MESYLMTPDGKLVEWKSLQRVDEPIFESSSDNEQKFSLGDICEFHCEVEANIEKWQQLVDETEKQTLEAFDILEQATEICIKSDGDLCSKCPMWKYGRHENCEEWVIANIRKLIENQKRLYMQTCQAWRKERE